MYAGRKEGKERIRRLGSGVAEYVQLYYKSDEPLKWYGGERAQICRFADLIRGCSRVAAHQDVSIRTSRHR